MAASSLLTSLLLSSVIVAGSRCPADRKWWWNVGSRTEGYGASTTTTKVSIRGYHFGEITTPCCYKNEWCLGANLVAGETLGVNGKEAWKIKCGEQDCEIVDPATGRSETGHYTLSNHVLNIEGKPGLRT